MSTKSHRKMRRTPPLWKMAVLTPGMETGCTHLVTVTRVRGTSLHLVVLVDRRGRQQRFVTMPEVTGGRGCPGA